MIRLSRRDALLAGSALGLMGLAGCGSSQGGDLGTLVIGAAPEPPTLTSATTTAGPTQYVSPKIFDGLVTFDKAGNPLPQLALSWETAPDGLTITFKLRPKVRWHDGKPFIAEDVSFSLLEVWRKYHARGRSTFEPVETVETPDPLTVVIRLSKPAPYLITALGSPESQILPKHIYAGKDVRSNPANSAPIGTGPFKFVEWRRGEYIRLARNPDYWQAGAPHLDGVIYKIFSDSAATAAALETGEIHLATNSQLSLSDVTRFKKSGAMHVAERPTSFTAALTVFEFNLDRPHLKDPRVRQAIAHAIDKKFLLDHVWQGFGSIEDSPIPQAMTAFSDPEVQRYPFDPEKAKALLDAAGLKPDAKGIRLTLTHDPAPTGDAMLKAGLAIRDNLARVGIDLQIRSGDFASFLKRVYTDRDFDTILYGASAGPDPAIGTQRFYWSPNFKPGVAFSNGAHYVNPAVDRLLEDAQHEPDLAKRRALYASFQEQVERDLPRIPLIAASIVTVASPRVRDLPDTAYAAFDNFAGVSLAPA